jgi:hypothetical protein
LSPIGATSDRGWSPRALRKNKQRGRSDQPTDPNAVAQRVQTSILGGGISV